MPTYSRDDGKPIVQFDADLEVSPFALYRRLKGERPPLLIDGRKVAASGRTLAGAFPYPDENWTPEDSQADIVVFDEDGTEAVEVALRLRALGCARARILFGGLDLYEFSLDPEIVGTETFLVRY